jgi:NAD(P)-dependent dehydrogenase (short-subunit alcohol dehydrogenase family)
MAKTILITGASSGIGEATARLFSRKGWNVMATMRSPEKAGELAGLPGVTVHELDVTDLGTIQRTVQEGLSAHGAIDAVVNNAGYGMVGPFEASSAERVERQFATNVFGLMNVTREVLPSMRERRSGTIVNMSSVGGRITFPLYSVYHATKFAVEGFSESLQYELREFNIRVKIIEPGPIRTPFYDQSQDLVTKEGLDAYDTFVAKALPHMQKEGHSAPGPSGVAFTVWEAVRDSTYRMRYPINAEGMLSLRKLLPDRAVFKLVRTVLLR